MRKTAEELALEATPESTWDKILRGGKNALMWAGGLGAGGMVGSLAGHYGAKYIPQKHIPTVIGALSAGAMLTESARRARVKEEEQAKNNRVLLHLNDPSQQALVHEYLMNSVPKKNPYSVYTHTGGPVSGTYLREIMLPDHEIDKDQLRQAVWGT